jgi:hypothetical protein
MVELTVTIDDLGKPSIRGPIENKLLSYGLLEVARELIHDHHAQKQQQQRVQLASVGTAPGFRD